MVRVPKGALTSEQARAWMAAKIDAEPVLGPAPDLSPEARAVAEFVAPRLRHTGGFLQSFFSEIFDVDKPPLYKQFLLLEADQKTLRITCCAAIGVEEEPSSPTSRSRSRYRSIPRAPRWQPRNIVGPPA